MPTSVFNRFRLHKYRATLTFEHYYHAGEFNPYKIFWRKALNLEPAEKLKYEIEELPFNNEVGKKYRITLTLEVMEDEFLPYQIDWPKALNLPKNNNCSSYVEDFESPTFWRS